MFNAHTHATNLLMLNSLNTTESLSDTIEMDVYTALMEAHNPYQAVDQLTDAMEVIMQSTNVVSIANTSAGFALERIIDCFIGDAPRPVWEAYTATGGTMTKAVDLWATIA